MADPTSKGVPIAWEPEPTGVHALADGGESPLQRIDRRVNNIQRGTEVSIKMIHEHSAKDETALAEIGARLSTQDRLQFEHGVELKAQSRQLDTLVRVIAPRSGATSTELKAEIQKQIADSDKAQRRNRNIELLKIAGAVVVALLGATGGIAAIIKILHG